MSNVENKLQIRKMSEVELQEINRGFLSIRRFVKYYGTKEVTT